MDSRKVFNKKDKKRAEKSKVKDTKEKISQDLK